MAQTGIVSMSAVVATRNRPAMLARALESLREQSVRPAELVVVDASVDGTPEASRSYTAQAERYGGRAILRRANQAGAAAQRNEGIALATEPTILFFDDDILFEPDCIARLWRALNADANLGGVNAMITNQRYQTPGRASRTIFRIMNGRAEPSYAGRVLGPAIALLPEDANELPDVVNVDWLNLGCTLYRREALPRPAFPSHFTGYSLMEDLALSLTVGRCWNLANVRTARIYHDFQRDRHKTDAAARSQMELVNRHYVMTEVLGRRRALDYAQLALWEIFKLATMALREPRSAIFWQKLRGKIDGIAALMRGRVTGSQ